MSAKGVDLKQYAGNVPVNPITWPRRENCAKMLQQDCEDLVYHTLTGVTDFGFSSSEGRERILRKEFETKALDCLL